MRGFLCTAILCLACSGKVWIEGAQGGYEIRVHELPESVSTCLERVDGIEFRGSGWSSEGRFLSFLFQLPEGDVDLTLVPCGRGSKLSVMSSRAKLSGRAVRLLEKHIRSCEIGTEPIDLGEIGRQPGA